MNKGVGNKKGKRLIKNKSSSASPEYQPADDLEIEFDLEDYKFDKGKDKSKGTTNLSKEKKTFVEKPVTPPKKEVELKKSLTKEIQQLEIASNKSSALRKSLASNQIIKKQPSITDYFNKGGKTPQQQNKSEFPFQQQGKKSTDYIEDIKPKRSEEVYKTAFLEEKPNQHLLQVQMVEEVQNSRHSTEMLKSPSVEKIHPQVEKASKKGKTYGEMFGRDKQRDEIKKQLIIGKPLEGKTIVITGLINICSRDQLVKILEQFGAKVTQAVSGKTSLLITGDKLEDGRDVTEGAKYKLALQKKTSMVREDQLDGWFRDNMGISIDQLFGESELSKLYQKSLLLSNKKKDFIFDLPNQNDQQLQWADKYCPTCLPELVGHKTSIDQLRDWLQNWGRKDQKELQVEKKKNSFIMMQLGRFQLTGDKHSRACLISGVPGIGKSSTVRLLAEVLDYKSLETNASEQRNKAQVRTQIGSLIGNKLIFKSKLHSKFIIIMDEVDGMTGSDRGGIQQLIDCIKNTQVPIVCICNDNEHPKLRSLISHCYHIKFTKPSEEQVTIRLQQICEIEKLKMSKEELLGVSRVFDCDLRQSINFLQLMNYSKGARKPVADRFSKDQSSIMNVFGAAIILLNREKREPLKLREKLDLYFMDFDLIPLIVQDSYLLAMKKKKKQEEKDNKKEGKKGGKKGGKKTQIDEVEEKPKDKIEHYNYSLKDLENMSKAADSIASGNILNRSIRMKQNWGLMPSFGVLSSIYPCELVGEELAFPKFPEFLGKFSSKRKISREILEIKKAIAKATYNASTYQIKFEYGPIMFKYLKLILKRKFHSDDQDAAWGAVEFLEEYNLNPEDLKNNLHDIMFNPMKVQLLSDIDASMKANLTRLFNKRHQILKLNQKKGKKQINVEIEQKVSYNPLIGEEAPGIEEGENVNENENGEKQKAENSVSKSKSKTTKKKRNSTKNPIKKQVPQKKTQSKKQQSSESEEEAQNSLSDFINDDEDD